MIIEISYGHCKLEDLFVFSWQRSYSSISIFIRVFTIEILNLEPTCRLPYIHGLCSSMDRTWRPLVEKFCILLWQTRVGREIVRYKRERKEEMKWERSRGDEKSCKYRYRMKDRNKSINRKGTYILADVLAMDNSTVGAATRLFLRIFSEVTYCTYIRAIKNSTF
jgi:hypothetical protein